MARGIIHGYRSGLEEKLAAQIEAAGIPVRFEAAKITYTVPEKTRRYTPDFVFERPGDGSVWYVESKGRLVKDDREKHELIKAQHPEVEIRFVFQRSKSPIAKGSKTTYADWADRNGFLYADKAIPQEWLNEQEKPPCNSPPTTSQPSSRSPRRKAS